MPVEIYVDVCRSSAVMQVSQFYVLHLDCTSLVLYIDVSIWEFMERSTVHDMCTGTYHTSK